MKNRENEELGLEATFIIGRHLLGTEYLHYGYWTDDLRPDIRNLAEAQKKYSEFLISHIPDGAETVLDVGCGTGRLALDIADSGRRVDCVSPASSLTGRARELLGERARVFESRLEDFHTDDRYDVVVFAESFQYVDMEKALGRTVELLEDGGHLLICDLFKTDFPGRCGLRGGYHFSKFEEAVSRTPLRLVEDLDITKETAPNIDIGNDLMKNVVRPLAELADRRLHERRPWIHKLLRWNFRKRIDKFDRSFTRSDRTSEAFAAYRTYRLLLYRKTGD